MLAVGRAAAISADEDLATLAKTFGNSARRSHDGIQTCTGCLPLHLGARQQVVTNLRTHGIVAEASDRLARSWYGRSHRDRVSCQDFTSSLIKVAASKRSS